VSRESDDASISLAASAIEKLDLDDDVKSVLRAILGELAGQYQQAFIAMLETQRMQASALERLQTTLHLLIERIAPEISDRIPVPIRMATDDDPHAGTALVVADPIATGYTMSQADLAKALQLPQPDVSVLVRAFKLSDDEACAVVVRRGPKLSIVNFHPRALERFRVRVSEPPNGLDANQQSALDRVRRRLGRT